LLFGLCTFAAQALEVKPFSTSALNAAQAAGKPVAVHFHADWCPTCKAQQKSLAVLQTEKGLDITVLTASYDDEKSLKQAMNVRSQSTLVVFKGQQETRRLAGETSVDALRAALKTAL
jgi:thioredoxin 1